MYTTDDVNRLIAELGEEMAKRHAALMHPPVVVAPAYVAGDTDRSIANKAEADKATADPVAKANAEMVEMAGLEKKHSPAVEFEKTQFGLAVEMWDHVSDKFMWICKPAKDDGQAEVFMPVKDIEAKLAEWRKPVIEKHKAEVAKQKEADAAAKKAADAEAAKTAGTAGMPPPMPPVPASPAGVVPPPATTTPPAPAKA